MAQPELEKRVAALETAVAALSKRLLPGQKPARVKDWRSAVELFEFKDDPIMKEIIEEGRRIREEDRRTTSL